MSHRYHSFHSPKGYSLAHSEVHNVVGLDKSRLLTQNHNQAGHEASNRAYATFRLGKFR